MFPTRAVACITVIATVLAAQQLTPEVLLLARIKQKTGENLRTLPNYTCLQVIQRFQRTAAGKSKQIDTLRLEVAYIGGKELFARPGSDQFEDRELFPLGPGAIGNGAFALNARNIFLTTAASFEYLGEGEEVNETGRRVVRYRYRVPQTFSGYGVRVGAQEAVVGIHGTFSADADTYELLRLDIVSDDIPPVLQLLSSTEHVEYGRTTIGNSSFLLPRSAELAMVDFTGRESRNLTRFTECRQYAGQSTISFADTQAPALPSQSRLHVALAQAIDLRNAAVGDPVTAYLQQPLINQDAVVLPKNTALSGRITRLERQNSRYLIAIEFSEVAMGNQPARLFARLASVDSPGLPERSDRARRLDAFETKARRLPAGLRLTLIVQ